MSNRRLRTAFRPPLKCSQLLSFASLPDSRAAPEVPLGPPVQRVELSVAAVPRDGAVVAHGTNSGIIVVTTAPFAGYDHQRRLVVTLPGAAMDAQRGVAPLGASNVKVSLEQPRLCRDASQSLLGGSMQRPEACLAGVDWTSEAHHVRVVDGDGSKRAKRIFRHSGAGLAEMADWIAAKCGGIRPGPMAIEVPPGPVLERLMDRGLRSARLSRSSSTGSQPLFACRGQGRDPRRPCPCRRAEDRSSPLLEDRPG